MQLIAFVLHTVASSKLALGGIRKPESTVAALPSNLTIKNAA
jgi:hypothetical protein